MQVSVADLHFQSFLTLAQKADNNKLERYWMMWSCLKRLGGEKPTTLGQLLLLSGLEQVTAPLQVRSITASANCHGGPAVRKLLLTTNQCCAASQKSKHLNLCAPSNVANFLASQTSRRAVRHWVFSKRISKNTMQYSTQLCQKS